MAFRRPRLSTSRRQPFLLSDFLGLNDDQNNSSLDNRHLRKARNLTFFQQNIIGGRYGHLRDPHTTALNSGAPLTFVGDLISEAGADIDAIYIAGSKIYKEDEGGTVSDETGALAISGTTQNDVWVGSNFKENLILANGGADLPLLIAKGDPPVPSFMSNAAGNWFANDRKPWFIHAQFNYVFAAGFTGTSTNENPMVVKHSGLNDHTTWLEENQIDRIGSLSPFGDEWITGLFRHRDFLMIGTNKRIYPVSYTGDTVFGRFVVQRPLEVGLAHQRAVCSVYGEFTFFMDPFGRIHQIREIAETFGPITSREISFNLKGEIDQLNRARIKYATCAFIQDTAIVCFAVSSGAAQGTNNKIFVLHLQDYDLQEADPRQARWTVWDSNIDANCLSALRRNVTTDVVSSPDSDGPLQLVFGTTTGFTKRFSPSTFQDQDDTGTAQKIPTELETKYFDFTDPNVEKSIVEIFYQMQPAITTVGPLTQIFYDFELTSSNQISLDLVAPDAVFYTWGSGPNVLVWGQGKWSQPSTDIRVRAYYMGAGTLAALNIKQETELDNTWKLRNATIVAELRGISPEVPGG